MTGVTREMNLGGVALQMKRIRRPDGGSLVRGMVSALARTRAEAVQRRLVTLCAGVPSERIVPAE